MARQLKSWESPRREGRNDKGKGGSARQRQRRKQFQMLRQRLKEQSKPSDKNDKKGGSQKLPLFASETAACFRDSRRDIAVVRPAIGTTARSVLLWKKR